MPTQNLQPDGVQVPLGGRIADAQPLTGAVDINERGPGLSGLTTGSEFVAANDGSDPEFVVAVGGLCGTGREYLNTQVLPRRGAVLWGDTTEHQNHNPDELMGSRPRFDPFYTLTATETVLAGRGRCSVVTRLDTASPGFRVVRGVL